MEAKSVRMSEVMTGFMVEIARDGAKWGFCF